MGWKAMGLALALVCVAPACNRGGAPGDAGPARNAPGIIPVAPLTIPPLPPGEAGLRDAAMEGGR
jgi:hypothetical protein